MAGRQKNLWGLGGSICLSLCRCGCVLSCLRQASGDLLERVGIFTMGDGLSSPFSSCAKWENIIFRKCILDGNNMYHNLDPVISVSVSAVEI